MILPLSLEILWSIGIRRLLLKERLQDRGGKLYAVVAPAISTQFTYAKLGQVISGIKALGFDEIVEAALGADMIAIHEAAELVEKGF